MDFAIPLEHKKIRENKKKSKKTWQLLRHCQGAKNVMEHEIDSDITHSWITWNSSLKYE